MDKNIIIKNFSRHARHYDKYADIQKKVASKMLEDTISFSPADILEIGCGTGNYTKLLKERFSQSNITAVDICKDMIAVAKEKSKALDIDFITADAEDLSFKRQFDFITSNACFQWFENLEGALSRLKMLLRKDGRILFSIFGPETLRELSFSLKHISHSSVIVSEGFINKSQLESALRKYFHERRVREAIYTKCYHSVKELLQAIKYTGTRGEGLNKEIRLNRKSLRSLGEYYLDNFSEPGLDGKNRIKATYQVFFCQGST